jgi:hypothetical protein
MSRLLTLATILLAWAGCARAADSDCATGSHLAIADFPLPHAAEAVEKSHRLDIVVDGTGSSTLGGGSGASLAYPARLEAALVKRLPGVEVHVTSTAKARQTAGDMVKNFGQLLAQSRPTLVVWQSGTFDAMRGVDPDDFRASLEEGIEELQAGSADVVLMNMQYSPRTESMISIGAYAEHMRVVSQQRQVPLFDRLAIMKTWSETGTFDLYAATRNLETATRVHDCIGQLLADVIVDAIKLSKHQGKALP